MGSLIFGADSLQAFFKLRAHADQRLPVLVQPLPGEVSKDDLSDIVSVEEVASHCRSHRQKGQG